MGEPDTETLGVGVWDGVRHEVEVLLPVPPPGGVGDTLVLGVPARPA